MMPTDCRLCDGEGNMIEKKEAKLSDIDKKSDSYKDAIAQLKKIHPDYTKKQLDDLFAETFNKL